ncbi:galactose-specific lectin nattectin-like isoform X4 [Hippocampus zosterae]|uniref:galactose-specific lectin nattectin-like isoform X3 n=1 Tax=Hippocampus zosterae TaxID=109293 RepID=UPI00223E4153|nr:galactose-specific lectin nattectin-like isoform X3 [Hippocampus zosterae]XP_051912967.1 galactose-specific lectin nattectin-like isoform X4 [Hippocampus zosterae]XP_051912968.1 galactose-specific lectin nattectin-like isoform X4 [Hippocampus zosterae]
MAFALRSLLLLCGISALLTGVWSFQVVKVPSCPKGWVRLENRCFYVVDQHRAFEDAERACQALGGNLASILNAREQVVVRALIDMRIGVHEVAWIGYNDRNIEGTFVWTDNSPSGFDAFNGPDPNNVDQDCVQTNAGTNSLFWEDEACATTVPFVCVTNVH